MCASCAGPPGNKRMIHVNPCCREPFELVGSPATHVSYCFARNGTGPTLEGAPPDVLVVSDKCLPVLNVGLPLNVFSELETARLNGIVYQPIKTFVSFPLAVFNLEIPPPSCSSSAGFNFSFLTLRWTND